MSDTALEAILQAQPLLRGLDSAALSYSVNARLRGGAAWPLDYVAAESFAPELAQLATRDGTVALAAADVLAHLMRGALAGYSDDQASLAAAVYAAWRLPFGPAATLLIDPRASASSRSYAVSALRPHWSDSLFVPAAAAALCSMAARSLGVARILGDSSVLTISEVLDHEEFDLVVWIVRALGSVHAGRAPAGPRLRSYLPGDNAVSAYLRRAAPQVW